MKLENADHDNPFSPDLEPAEIPQEVAAAETSAIAAAPRPEPPSNVSPELEVVRKSKRPVRTTLC